MTQFSAAMVGCAQGTNLLVAIPRDGNGGNAIITRGRQLTDQQITVAVGSISADCTQLTMSCKSGSAYAFDYDLMYSTSVSVASTVAFAVSGTGGNVSAFSLALMTGSSAGLLPALTTTVPGGFLSTSSIVGGGSFYARLVGGLTFGGTGGVSGGGDIVLSMRVSGLLNANMTLLANSRGNAYEL